MVPSPDAPPPAGPGRAPARSRWRVVLWVLAGLVVAALVVAAPALLDQDDRPAERGQPPPRRPFPGFGEGTLRVLVVAPGSRLAPADHCSLLAATAEAQARGLMTRSDLGGYASMVFRYASDVRLLFYNRNVPMALTVAFFDGEGRWVGSRDLEPCPDMEGCPTIGSPAPYRYAVEVEKGGLARLGLGPGSQIAFSEGC